MRHEVAERANEHMTSGPELRAALELLLLRCGATGGRISGAAYGAPPLVQQFQRYAAPDGAPERAVALAASPEELVGDLLARRPHVVLTLSAGRLNCLLSPLRNGGRDMPDDLPERTWSELGYRMSRERGVQGFGALAWVLGERVARRCKQPALADRCRIAMQRTLVASRRSGAFTALVVREYRSVA